jgi:hypothetical protein
MDDTNSSMPYEVGVLVLLHVQQDVDFYYSQKIYTSSNLQMTMEKWKIIS